MIVSDTSMPEPEDLGRQGLEWKARFRPHLTYREIEVLRGFARGLTDQSIADHLGLSLGAIHSRTRTTYTKLGARSRPHAVAIAFVWGLLGEADIVTTTPLSSPPPPPQAGPGH